MHSDSFYFYFKVKDVKFIFYHSVKDMMTRLMKRFKLDDIVTVLRRKHKTIDKHKKKTKVKRD